MHVAMVYMDGHKMSKSLGNLVFVDALRTECDPRAIRLAIIEHHYRDEWEWDDDLMPRGNGAAARLVSGPERADDGVVRDVRAALDDDLDTPARWRPSTAWRAAKACRRAALLGVATCARPRTRRPSTERAGTGARMLDGPVTHRMARRGRCFTRTPVDARHAP